MKMRSVFVALTVTALVGVVLAQDVARETGDPAARHLLAPALALWVIQSRDAAIARGVEDMPSEIRKAFDEFVSSDVLDSVQWRIDGETGVVGRSLFLAGAVRAVTLDNVIVFANANEAANAKLWAHELFHVLQYRQWGVEEFASRYVADRRAVEHAAREFRWSWMKATGRVPSPAGE
ncbi:MAG: DUF4157 domain-containing protein [Gammaproteobacteria bacterium]|jgi:hypothetical protein